MNKLIPLTCLSLFSVGLASATELYGEINAAYVFSKIDDEKFLKQEDETIAYGKRHQDQ